MNFASRDLIAAQPCFAGPLTRTIPSAASAVTAAKNQKRPRPQAGGASVFALTGSVGAPNTMGGSSGTHPSEARL